MKNLCHGYMQPRTQTANSAQIHIDRVTVLDIMTSVPSSICYCSNEVWKTVYYYFFKIIFFWLREACAHCTLLWSNGLSTAAGSVSYGRGGNYNSKPAAPCERRYPFPNVMGRIVFMCHKGVMRFEDRVAQSWPFGLEQTNTVSF